MRNQLHKEEVAGSGTQGPLAGAGALTPARRRAPARSGSGRQSVSTHAERSLADREVQGRSIICPYHAARWTHPTQVDNGILQMEVPS